MSRADASAHPPAPGDTDRAIVAREMLRESDELPWMIDEEPEPDPTWLVREVRIHTHQLCGHECLSGACSTLEAICISCEFVLQDAREPRNSRGMNRSD